MYGQIMTPARSGMNHARGDKFVYCHEALHMRAKLGSAGSVQSVAEWESDSDTDASDDEEDLKV